MRTKMKSMTRRNLLGTMGLAAVTLPLPGILAWAKPSARKWGKGWATGGTAAMTGAKAYPNPFTSELDTVCRLTCAQSKRGVQTTDDQGRVDFDTCFPGWYPSRNVHSHFTLTVAGMDSVTSQLYFDDALNDDILSTQPLYNTWGVRDTRNADDLMTAPDKKGDFLLRTQRMSDGALLAWKTFIIRSSMDTPLYDATSEEMRRMIRLGIPPLETEHLAPPRHASLEEVSRPGSREARVDLITRQVAASVLLLLHSPARPPLKGEGPV